MEVDGWGRGDFSGGVLGVGRMLCFRVYGVFRY